MRNKTSTGTDGETIPNVIKKKLEKTKTEGRLMNKKDLILGNYVTIRSKENIANKKIKVLLEILNYASLELKPVVPRYGKLISDVLRIVVTDAKGIEITKNKDISFSIKSPEIDRYCYPLLLVDDRWKIAESFCIVSDGISITDCDWNTVVLIKEPPNEIITISPNGGMIYSELDKVTCLRVPKGNFRETVTCKIQFVDMSMENLADFQSVYEDQLTSFIQLSQLFIVQLIDTDRDLIDDIPTLRRVVSVKIPLPDWVISNLNDIDFDTKKTVQDQRKEKLGFYLLQKVGDDWNFFDGNLKFTQTSLGIDIKQLGSFIFVNCRENREIRLCSQMTLVENLQSSEKGVVLVFLWLSKSQWFLWIELVSVNRIRSVRESLESNGLLFIEQSFERPPEIQISNSRRGSRRFSKKDVILRRTIDLYENIQFKLAISGDIENSESLSRHRTNVSKDSDNHSQDDANETHRLNDFDDFDRIGKRKVKFIDEKEEVKEIFDPDLTYHRYSQQSNAIIIPIKPIDRPIAQWTKIITDNLKQRSIYESSSSKTQEVIKVPINDTIQMDIDSKLIETSQADQVNISKLSDQERLFNFQCHLSLDVINSPTDVIIIPPQKFTFCIPIDFMKDYFNIITGEETREIERLKLENEQVIYEKEKERDSLISNEPNKPKTVNYSRIETLSNPRTRKLGITRDPKVLSSKSMLSLASVVRQGLTLAVYLSLPDNVIAGIGFDSLSQISMNGVNNTTYKVLVTWKKMIHLNKISESEYIEQLMDALRMVGYENLSILIHDHWKNNKDISVDDCQRCLLKRNDV